MMSDASEGMEKRCHAMLMKRSGQERFAMGCDVELVRCKTYMCPI
jgi:hypothetical protein